MRLIELKQPLYVVKLVSVPQGKTHIAHSVLCMLSLSHLGRLICGVSKLHSNVVGRDVKDRMHAKCKTCYRAE